MQGESTQDNRDNVGGLIADVEHKMAELMAWHQTQLSRFEAEKAAFQAEMQRQREALEAETREQQQALAMQRVALAEEVAQVEDQRIKLAALTNKLRAEESAMSREWGAVQHERESLQKQHAELAEQREQTQQRSKAWLDSTASELAKPLKLATQQAPEHEADHHHAA
ncbi:MAG: hypothetical protein ACPGYV_04155 [Phycisphaeraceae bacterium]